MARRKYRHRAHPPLSGAQFKKRLPKDPGRAEAGSAGFGEGAGKRQTMKISAGHVSHKVPKTHSGLHRDNASGKSRRAR